MSTVRWESDAELLADAADQARTWTDYGRSAIRRLREAAEVGRAVVLNEIGTPTLWSTDGARWDCLAAGSHEELRSYARAAGVLVPGLAETIALPAVSKTVRSYRKRSA